MRIQNVVDPGKRSASCLTCKSKRCQHCNNANAVCNSEREFADFLQAECRNLLRQKDDLKGKKKSFLALPHAPICRTTLPGIARPISPELAAKLLERGQIGLQGSIGTRPKPLIPQGTCECPLKPEYGFCFCNGSDNGSCSCGQPWSAATLVADQNVRILPFDC